MRISQWLRLRRKPPKHPGTFAERLDAVEAYARQNRVGGYVLYAIVIAATAVAVAAAVYAIDSADQATSSADASRDAIAGIQDLRRQRARDQAKTDKLLCENQREALTRLRETKLILAADADALEEALTKLIGLGGRNPESSAILERLKTKTSEHVTVLKAGARKLTLIINGDPKAKNEATRRGLDCDSLPSRQPFRQKPE